MQPIDNKKTRNFIIILLVALLISLILNIYQFIKQQRETASFFSLVKSKNILDKRFKDIKDEINRYKGLSEGLDSVIIEANRQIALKERTVLELITSNEHKEIENQKWIDEISVLKEKYLNTIDSLLVERQINSKLNVKIGSLETKIIALNKKLGSQEQFPIGNLEVSPKKATGLGVNETALAKKASEVQICYQVQHNKATPKGRKVVYIRIFDPNGHFLPGNNAISAQFLHPDYNMSVPYTITDTIDYQNVDIDVCSRWKNPENYIPCVYLVELYTEKKAIGTTTFTLR